MSIVVIPIDDLEHEYLNGYSDLACGNIEFKDLVKYVFQDYLNFNYDIRNLLFPYHEEKTEIIELLIDYFVFVLEERISLFLPNPLTTYNFIDFVNNGIIIYISSDPKNKLLHKTLLR